MPDNRKRHATNIRNELAQIVRMLANKENRNFTQQVHTLMEEAIAQRDRQVSFKEVKRQLHDLSVLELANIIETASQIQQRRLQGTASLEIPNAVDNPLAAKTLENLTVCQQVFQQLPDGAALLERIINGEKPPDDTLPLLEMCLSIDTEEFNTLLEQSFGNAPNHNHS